MSSLTDDDMFFFNEAAKLEQEYLRLKQEQQLAPPGKSELQPVSDSASSRSFPHSTNSSSAPQLPPEILKRIEANRAAAQARLHQAAAKALSAQHHLPCTAAPWTASGCESDASSCSSQASITSYFKPDPCSASSQHSCWRSRPLSEVNAVLPPSSPVSSQRSVCAISAPIHSQIFQPFAPSAASQSQSRCRPCAACGAMCSGSCVLQYPEHPPLRDYQLQLARACVTRNTLVILPTGLGKTFIAGTPLEPNSRLFCISRHPYSQLLPCTTSCVGTLSPASSSSPPPAPLLPSSTQPALQLCPCLLLPFQPL
jgi:hypothetical protein